MVAYVRVGSEFIVNSTIARRQTESDGTRLVSGNFIISWIDTPVGVSGNRFIRAQIFQPDGTPTGSELTLETDSYATRPSILGLANGGFV
ncbi:MAG: hypothetical protein RL367_2312, partial [Pseudomonadota bacterium]